MLLQIVTRVASVGHSRICGYVTSAQIMWQVDHINALIISVVKDYSVLILCDTKMTLA